MTIPIPQWISGDLSGVSQTIINILLIVGGVAGVLGLIYSGYLYITAGGNPEQSQKAKSAILASIIGIIIIFSAYIIINFIVVQLFT